MAYEIWKNRGEIDITMCSKGGKIYLGPVSKETTMMQVRKGILAGNI